MRWARRTPCIAVRRARRRHLVRPHATLEAEEAGDDSSRRQLVEAFNAGFAGRQGQFPACSRRSHAAERSVAERGAALARRLAGLESSSP